MGRAILPRGKRSRNLKLNTLLHLVPSLRIGGVMLLIPVYAFIAWQGKLYLPLISCTKYTNFFLQIIHEHELSWWDTVTKTTYAYKRLRVYYIILYYIILYYIILCYAILCCAMLCDAMLYYIILYYIHCIVSFMFRQLLQSFSGRFTAKDILQKPLNLCTNSIHLN
jgi:hypothetical protein